MLIFCFLELRDLPFVPKKEHRAPPAILGFIAAKQLSILLGLIDGFLPTFCPSGDVARERIHNRLDAVLGLHPVLYNAKLQLPHGGQDGHATGCIVVASIAQQVDGTFSQQLIQAIPEIFVFGGIKISKYAEHWGLKCGMPFKFTFSAPVYSASPMLSKPLGLLIPMTSPGYASTSASLSVANSCCAWARLIWRFDRE